MDLVVDRIAHPDVSHRDSVVRFGGGPLTALPLETGKSTGAAAQDAIPANAIGVTAQAMGASQPATAPGLDISPRHITFAPGGAIPPTAAQGALVIFVGAGTCG